MVEWVVGGFEGVHTVHASLLYFFGKHRIPGVLDIVTNIFFHTPPEVGSPYQVSRLLDTEILMPSKRIIMVQT